MNYIGYLLFLITNIGYGQYLHDHRIGSHPFFKTVNSQNDRMCSSHYVYYEHIESDGVNGARLECYLLQEQIKDSLRAMFTDKELFEIAQYSKSPFYRIAAFELYSQTDYPKEDMIRFLKRGRIPTALSGYGANDTIAQMYIPMPNAMEPEWAPIRLKMLSFLYPGAKKRTRKDTLAGYIMVDIPAYPKTKALDLESYVDASCYMRYHCADYLWGFSFTDVRFLKPGEKKPKTPTFRIQQPVIDFGVIDLNYLNPGETDFELRGAFKVMNNTSKSITVMGQSSGHTMCTESKYVIPPKKEVLVEFKSVVGLNQPFIDRSITLTNVATGGTQLFKFKAQFVKPGNKQ